jgi:hypothetical protein
MNERTTRAAALVAVLMLAGCATSRSEEVRLPSGAPGYAIACPGGDGWNACYVAASELCPAAYSIVDRRTGLADGWNGGSRSTRSMLIQCKG